MYVWSEKNQKKLISLNEDCLKAISSVRLKKITESFQGKNGNIWNHFLKLYLHVHIDPGHFIPTTHRFNPYSIGRPDKGKRETHGS